MIVSVIRSLAGIVQNYLGKENRYAWSRTSCSTGGLVLPRGDLGMVAAHT